MEKEHIMIALDCGNSSFRTVAGQYKEGRLESRVLDQVPNGPVLAGGYYYWDILNIFEKFKEALKQAVKQYHVDSIGVCTWGVDFALFDREGHMLQNPLCYRNPIGETCLGRLSSGEREMLFDETGILCDKINSVYMLLGMKELFPSIYKAADKCLMIPDILNYFLTGEMIHEPSEFSTTQLMDVGSGKISSAVCEKMGISETLFCGTGSHGERIGYLREDIQREIGADYEIPVICVPSHDTASAVAAIPVQEKDFGFISSGTWSLIGTELDAPARSREVREAGLTNEVGAFGKITLLKNSAGMFVVNCLKKEYEFEKGETVSWEEISRLAEACGQAEKADLNDGVFFHPASMSEAMRRYLKEKNHVEGPMDWGLLFRAFYESLASAYAETIREIQKATGKNLERIYIVGGGSSSRVLLRLMSESIGKPVVVCYGESTSMGNLAAQVKYRHPEYTLEDLRNIIRNSYRTEVIEPERG